MMPLRIRAGFLALAALAALSLASGPLRAEGVPVTIALSSSTLAYGGLRIAEQAGLFRRHGIDPRIIVMDSGNAAIAAVLSRSAEFSASGPGEVLAARVRGREVVILANIYRGLSGSLVLAKTVAEKLGVAADAPLEQRLRALDGLAIAAPSATSAYLTPIKSVAEAAGAKIKFVYMTQPAMVAALQAGAVQGVIAGAPFSLTPVSNGSGVLWISGPAGELPEAARPASSACLQTSAEYAQSHPDVVRNLQAVFTDLARLITEQPEQARQLLAKAYPQLDPASAAAAFTESAANWSRPVMTEADIEQEIMIQASTGALPGVKAIVPASVLVGGR